MVTASLTYWRPHITLHLGAELRQPEAEARGAPQRVVSMERVGASSTLTALKAKDIFLKGKK